MNDLDIGSISYLYVQWFADVSIWYHKAQMKLLLELWKFALATVLIILNKQTSKNVKQVLYMHYHSKG